MQRDSEGVVMKEMKGEQSWQPRKTSNTGVGVSPGKNGSHEILNEDVSR